MASITVRPNIGESYTCHDAHSAEWRVNERRSFTENRFFVDYVSNPRKGTRELIEDGLTKSEAELMVATHNASLYAGNPRGTRPSKLPCKLHKAAHTYLQHGCGHLYCAMTWHSCPRCFGSDVANLIQGCGLLAE